MASTPIRIAADDRKVTISGIEREEDISAFCYLALGSNVSLRVIPADESGKKENRITVIPDMENTSIDKVLVGIGMILGKMDIKVEARNTNKGRSFKCDLDHKGRWGLDTFINGSPDSTYGPAGVQETLYAIECFMGGTDEERVIRNKIINQMPCRNDERRTSD